MRLDPTFQQSFTDHLDYCVNGAAMPLPYVIVAISDAASAVNVYRFDGVSEVLCEQDFTLPIRLVVIASDGRVASTFVPKDANSALTN